MWKVSVIVALLAAVATYILPWLLESPVPEKLVFGSCTEQFSEVEKVFRVNFESGIERGSALSVYYRGESVCDMWGGYADTNFLRPWQRDSLSCWWSTTKAVTAISVLTLVDKGFLDVQKPVSHYWPLFSKNSKGQITVEQLMSHSAGLAVLDTPLTYDQLMNDPAWVSKAIEDQTPNWTPGSKHGYHALTLGILLDQLVRRVDPKQRSLQQYFKEEIAAPHGIDFSIGLPLSEQHRAVAINQPSSLGTLVALLSEPSIIPFMYNYFNPNTPQYKSVHNPSVDLPGSEGLEIEKVYNWPETRKVPDGSSSGSGTARAVAKLLGLIPSGKLFQHASTTELFNHPVRNGIDYMSGMNVTYGYGLQHFFSQDDESKHRVGTPGHGGQMGFVDVEHEFSYAYTTNHMKFVFLEKDPRTKAIVDAIYRAIENN